MLCRGRGERPAVTQVESSSVSVRGSACGLSAGAAATGGSVDCEDPPHVS